MSGDLEVAARKKEQKRSKKRSRQEDTINNDDTEKKSKLTQPTVISHIELGTKVAASMSANHSVEDSVTLEERLQALSRTYLETATATEVRAVPSSDSLVVLLEQALQSGDDVLLEQCLACDDNDVIEATSAHLPTARIFAFIRRLVSKFEKRPSRGLLLTRWLSAILKYHAAYLISLPDLAQKLTSVSQIMEQRLASCSRLASLGGRLDLLMSHVATISNKGGDKADARKPKSVVKET
jgi:hypothetical protein